ncbi:unnamed protein product [Alopecurus aequalis]
MAVVDWIELSDDDDEEQPMVREGVVEVGTNAHLVALKQEILEVGYGVEEAVQPGNQVLLAVGNGVKEATQPGSAGKAASALSSLTEQGLAEGDCAEEAIQSKHADKATASAPLTEQDEHQSRKADASLVSPPTSTAAPLPRQFWKAGEYTVAAQASINNGQNCLRINPKFLHSNATSHKWAFGAVAELLDNAVDEVQNGATYVKIDKTKYSPVEEYSLVIQDDGGGMSPEYLRYCLSFGFSNKCTNSSIGQYGNGFKTSAMRLGADAIIFSCRQDKSRLTRSVGLLSYTFLTRTGCSDILVPVVDYEFDQSSCTFKRIMDRGEKHFSSNLSTLLRWSPFSTEDDLLNQFGDMGLHGTKIVVFNLWFNDAMEMELDFETDDEDIMISGAPGILKEHKKTKRLNHMHVANRFRYSLRVYASILYLHLPEHFKVILCGRVVEPHHIVSDLIYRECIKYRPQVGASVQADVITTIGFLKGAPYLNIFGFNIYHRNRLILEAINLIIMQLPKYRLQISEHMEMIKVQYGLVQNFIEGLITVRIQLKGPTANLFFQPFWSGCSERGHGRGIAGVLEANFIRPTHDKQDFEKTELFQRLDTRLKDMTTEYWRHHAVLIYPNHAHRHRHRSTAKASVVLDPCYNEGNSQNHLHNGVSRDQMDNGACMPTPINRRTSFCMPSIPQQTEPCKRRNSGLVIESRAQKRPNTNDDPGSVNVAEMGEERSRVLIYQNETLKAECAGLEAAGHHLLSKAEELRNELHVWQRMQRRLTDELQFHDGLSALRHTTIPMASSSYTGVGWI